MWWGVARTVRKRCHAAPCWALTSTGVVFCACIPAGCRQIPAALHAHCGSPGIRTLTVRILNPLPLPIGLESHALAAARLRASSTIAATPPEEATRLEPVSLRLGHHPGAEGAGGTPARSRPATSRCSPCAAVGGTHKREKTHRPGLHPGPAHASPSVGSGLAAHTTVIGGGWRHSCRSLGREAAM